MEEVRLFPGGQLTFRQGARDQAQGSASVECQTKQLCGTLAAHECGLPPHLQEPILGETALLQLPRAKATQGAASAYPPPLPFPLHTIPEKWTRTRARGPASLYSSGSTPMGPGELLHSFCPKRWPQSINALS